MNLKLGSKNALVTGAAGLLGIEHVKALLSAGANVVCTDISEENLLNLETQLGENVYPGVASYHKVDVTEESDLMKLKNNLSKTGVKIDLLINNAALNPKLSTGVGHLDNSFEKFSLDRWNSELDVNLTGSFLCCKIFGSEMAERKSGVIVNIASDLSVIAPDNRLYSFNENEIEKTRAKPVSYSVSKTAIIGLTRYLAAYWAASNVRVNSLSPGGVLDNQPLEFLTRIQKLIPLGRMANADEYHGALVFLCSDDSAYLTGHNLIIDGGRSII
jgi:NAD(P)-dependent dehydrogenase (short-subunit alcohol dehydrogenase family)